MPSDRDIQSELSAAIERDDTIWLRQTIAENSLACKSELDGWLSVASQMGHLATMRVLLVCGVNVNWANDDGETAFSYACARNQFAVAKIIHALGAEINRVDSSGGSPLDWAVCHGEPDFRVWLHSVGGVRNFYWDEWPWPPPEHATLK